MSVRPKPVGLKSLALCRGTAFQRISHLALASIRKDVFRHHRIRIAVFVGSFSESVLSPARLSCRFRDRFIVRVHVLGVRKNLDADRAPHRMECLSNAFLSGGRRRTRGFDRGCRQFLGAVGLFSKGEGQAHLSLTARIENMHRIKEVTRRLPDIRRRISAARRFVELLSCCSAVLNSKRKSWSKRFAAAPNK